MITPSKVPPGVLLMQDLCSRFPDRCDELLAYEIARRERELDVYRTTYRLIDFHLWTLFRTAFFSGLTVFSLAWAVGWLSYAAHWVLQVRQAAESAGLSRSLAYLPIDLAPVLPSSTSTSSVVLNTLTRLPVIDWHQAAWLALTVMTIVVFVRLFSTYTSWHQARAMKRAIRALEEELEIWRSWRKEG